MTLNPSYKAAAPVRRTERQARAVDGIKQFLNGHPAPSFTDRMGKTRPRDDGQSGRRRYKWCLKSWEEGVVEIDDHKVAVINEWLEENGYGEDERAYLLSWKDEKGRRHYDRWQLVCCVNP